MIPFAIDPSWTNRDAVHLIAEKATVDCDLAARVWRTALRLPFSLQITSGYRSPARQEELGREGYPTAPVHLSNHTVCPARAVDVAIVGVAVVTDEHKWALGAAAQAEGLRWGGGSPVNPQTGIPSDWVHLDLGPRPPHL